jgi:hypothetical protein
MFVVLTFAKVNMYDLNNDSYHKIIDSRDISEITFDNI